MGSTSARGVIMDDPESFFQAIMVAIGFLAAAFFRASKVFSIGLDESLKELVDDIDHRQTELEKCLAVFMAEVRGRFTLLTTRLESIDDEIKR